MLGGWIADRWLGAKKTVIIGITLMTAGHAAMVFEQSFLLALVLLILGSGCLKGNIAAQVGQLYPPNDPSAATRGYTIFSTAINVGAVFGPIVCGALAQIYGWHYGFGVAGIFMLVAAIYWIGRGYLPDEKPSKTHATDQPQISTAQWRTVALLFAVMALTVLQSISVDQFYNVGLIYVAQSVDLNTALGAMPAGWFISINSLGCVLAAPFLISLWKDQAKRGTEPSDFTKMAIGAFIIGASSICMAMSSMQLDSGKAGALLPVLAFFLMGVGFMWYWPTLLAIVARYSPNSIQARMMAMVYLTAFASGLSSGLIGSFYERMTPTEFWLLNTSLALVGGAVFFCLWNRLKTHD